MSAYGHPAKTNEAVSRLSRFSGEAVRQNQTPAVWPDAEAERPLADAESGFGAAPEGSAYGQNT